MEREKIVIICGPTGVGKTGVAVEVGSGGGFEIVSADSMQVYRFMDIGTAKPTMEEQGQVKHHLIDVLDPDQPFDAASFASAAEKIIKRLVKKRRIPLVVGGTGLYIKALLGGIVDEGAPDFTIRKRLLKRLDEKGAAYLHRILERLDPKAAEKIHENDRVRVLRALEVRLSTGRSITELQAEHAFKERKFEYIKIGLNIPRESLYKRIDTRVDMMMQAGFLDEVRGLIKRGYDPSLKSMQAIGYRHMVGCLTGRTSLDKAVEALKRDTRRYAKRQLTWFRADHEIIWKRPDEISEIKRLICDFTGKGL